MSATVPLYGFGGGGGSGGTLTVTAPAGVTVTVTKDGKTRTKVAGTDGLAVFKGLSAGVWLVTITDGVQTTTKTVTITTDYSTVISFNTIPEFTYTGDYEIVNDADEPITTSQDNWKIRLLTSGTLTFNTLNGAENGIDVFCVGGGGCGGTNYIKNSGGGGGGGYTKTVKGINVSADAAYDIVVGAGGGITTAFGATAENGENATKNSSNATVGGSGGSGGSGGTTASVDGCNGGSDGADGSSGAAGTGGAGQGTTTREFGESEGKLYSGGGGAGAGGTAGSAGTGGSGGGGDGGAAGDSGNNGANNTGGGGGGAGGSSSGTSSGGSGGSGIVIIRNARGVA